MCGGRTESRKKLGKIFLLGFVASVLLSACSGGGGGEDDTPTGPGGNLDPNKRTSNTGVRVIHAALDVEPVDVKVGETPIGRAHFMDVTYYNSVKKGLQTIAVERANSPGVVLGSFSADLQDKTEYTVVLSGQSGRDTFGITTLEEPVVRPEKGLGRVQIINALENSSPLTLTIGTVTTLPTPYRLSSGFTEVPSGIYNYTVTDSRGRPLAAGSGAVPDQGELNIVVGGAANRGVVIAKQFTDLD